MCGECCRAPVILITKTEDYRRWTRQRRSDILQYASVPPLQGYGDLWIDIKGSEGSSYCSFIKKVGNYKYICTIHNTKPKVCKEFRCEWAYWAGKKGIPFKTERGWTDKAKQLGYGKTETLKAFPEDQYRGIIANIRRIYAENSNVKGTSLEEELKQDGLISAF